MPSPADLPNPEIKPGSPPLQADSLPTELSGSPQAGKGGGTGGATDRHQVQAEEDTTDSRFLPNA